MDPEEVLNGPGDTVQKAAVDGDGEALPAIGVVEGDDDSGLLADATAGGRTS